MNQFPENAVEMINGLIGGFNKSMGLRFVKATPNEFVAEIEIDERHLQPYGIVHGGVYAGMIETLCSTGAALNVYSEGKSAVGLENTTSFLRAVRSGTLRGTARPVLTGRRSHVWEAQVTDDRDRLVATGRVRLLVLEPGSEADGITVELNAKPE
ncbi:MAG: PaaI family thioesterase [Desulfobacterales bacterium]|nr:PaaI family thioesterase [Desulfobacterales bacterium]